MNPNERPTNSYWIPKEFPMGVMGKIPILDWIPNEIIMGDTTIPIWSQRKFEWVTYQFTLDSKEIRMGDIQIPIGFQRKEILMSDIPTGGFHKNLNVWHTNSYGIPNEILMGAQIPTLFQETIVRNETEMDLCKEFRDSLGKLIAMT